MQHSSFWGMYFIQEKINVPHTSETFPRVFVTDKAFHSAKIS